MAGTATDSQIVLAAVIERVGRYLICQRPAHKRHGSLWEFPGGKLEPGESLLQAAQRELREELGLTATRVGATRLSITDPGSPFVVTFVDVDAEGEPVLLEHSALDWLVPPDLLKLALAPSDRRFAELLNQPDG